MKVYKGDLIFSGVHGDSIIVEPEVKWRFIFWQGAQYVACMDLGGEVWFTPEWLETNSPEDFHCYEPIMDKRCKYSYAKVLETGPARVRVKWHYACCNVKYEIFHGNTEADEYYSIYPDGIAVRKLVAWPGDLNDFGGNPNFWQVLEYILINGAGTRPDKIVDKDEAFIFMNEKGERITFKWPLPTEDRIPLCKLHPEIKDWKIYIGKIKLRDRPSPFVAFIKDPRFFPYKPCIYCYGDHPFFGLFHANAIWKHWPASPMENFVLAVEAEEEEWGKIPTHTSFLDCNYTSIPADVPPKGCNWLFLVGASEDSNDDQIIDIVKSWAFPAKIQTGYESRRLSWGLQYGPILYEGYCYSERSYVFRLEGAKKLKFTLLPTEKAINPVFKVENWYDKEPTIFLGKEKLDRESFRWQFNGHSLLIWVKREITAPTEITIE
ncbi:MAG: hypothetical protein ABIM44_08515 [candidate division WOR-3 bacterium]